MNFQDVEMMFDRAGEQKPLVVIIRNSHEELNKLALINRVVNSKKVIKNESPPAPRPQPIVSRGKRIGRNDPCKCGSGKKFKVCCMRVRA